MLRPIWSGRYIARYLMSTIHNFKIWLIVRKLFLHDKRYLSGMKYQANAWPSDRLPDKFSITCVINWFVDIYLHAKNAEDDEKCRSYKYDISNWF